MARRRNAPPPRHESHEANLDEGERLVVVSDSHSSPHPRALELIHALRPVAIVHAGDVGDPLLLSQLRGVAPVVAVRGNVDPRSADLPETALLTLRLGEAAGLSCRALILHVALYGPRLQRGARDLARRRRAELVFCGHSHVPLLVQEGGLTVFNPGSIGPRRFSLPITFGVVSFQEGALQLHHVSCETGERWLPPA